MNREWEQAMQKMLDGDLSSDERVALNDALRSDPEAREEYCRQIRMHALLAWRAGVTTSEIPVVHEQNVIAISASRRLWRWCGWAAAALLMLGVMIFSLAPGPATAAAAVEAMRKAVQGGDRSYAIAVVEGDTRMAMQHGLTLTYEGALLHLRGERQFVLVRPIVEGGTRITGSDGKINWDIIGEKPVKRSSDLTRFRGGLPGEQQDATFLDLSGQLARLSSGYELSLQQSDKEPSYARLLAVKKSHDVRGPREIEFTFRRDSGIITVLEFRGLPRAKGGPEALRLTLTSESPLPQDFFTHTHHHEPGRRVQDDSPEMPEP